MTVAMDLAYLPGRKIEGKVLFLYPYLDSKTRTVRLRLAFDNRDGLLKPGMYGNVFLESVIDPNALVIPHEAVIDSGLRKVVFVSRGQGKFELRDVKLGIEGNDSTYQVLDGLQEGENIVISAQFMFDSESRLREAIQKMLEVRNGNDDKTDALSTDDLNIEALKMDSSELDISTLKMD
jgi:Cu(I)/Ag(I) efflux system membrane fusion protein/cobalt-zinc-cadmium efflux system membrane fusion protein